MTELIIAFLNGFSALALVCFSVIFASISFYFNRTKGSKVHLNMALLGIAVALGWTGILTTYLSVTIYGYNLPGIENFISYFSYCTIPLGILAVMYVVWDVFGSPTNKKSVLIIFACSCAFYYIILFATFEQAVETSEIGVIWDDWISPLSLFYYVLWAQVLIVSVITFVGFNKFRKATAGDLSKRSMLLLFACIIVAGSILLDTVIMMEAAVNFLFIPRFGMIFGLFLIYWSFRPSKA
jgi:hypothetical protein